MHTDRINFLDLRFDRLNFKEITARLHAVTSSTAYAYIVTPNVDHVVRIDREPDLRSLYESADLCVCDSRILKFLARLRGIDLPLIPGSDLSTVIFDQIIRAGDRIAVVGGDQLTVEQLISKFPEVHFSHFEPPMGLRGNPEARRSAADFIAASRARFSFIAVGSPQQEMIANEVRALPDASGVALCIGAGLDFIVGKQKRAPRVLQALGLEWAHRLATNPRRLWRRYLVEGVRIFPIWLRWRASAVRLVLVATVVFLVPVLVAAIIYAAVSNARSREGATSFNVPLPPPTAQSIAAVKALPPPNLLKPVSPEEAAKENVERPFVARADTAASRFVLRTDPQDRLRAATCLAQAVYYEAAGEGVDGGRAVAQVVLNRVHHPGFPSTVCGVVYQGADRPTGCQFSFTCDGSMQHIPVPWLWTRSRQIADEALKGHVFAPVGHATHYHADYVLPYWADSLDKSIQIGRHIFYRLPGPIGEARGFSQRYGGTEPPFHEPGATIALPPTGETQKLADTLINDGVAQPTNTVQKAKPQPSSPLLVDSGQSTLFADLGAAPVQQRSKKASADCAAHADRQISPLRADDMRTSASGPDC